MFGVKIGEGRYGVVYRGRLEDEGEVAVKVLKEVKPEVRQKVIAEMTNLGHLEHPNLVHMHGWCCHKKSLILVYEYMPHGDLRQLFLRKNHPYFSWVHRYKFICSLSAVLAYLHRQHVVHRDIKPSKVLFNENHDAVLSDFGITRLMDNASSIVSTDLRGTIAYLAPEYIMTLKLGPECDVYSFGMMVLELCTGIEASSVLDYVKKLYDEGRLLDAGDIADITNYEVAKEQLKRSLHLGIACTDADPKRRPDMEWVVNFLSSNVDYQPIDHFQALPSPDNTLG